MSEFSPQANSNESEPDVISAARILKARKEQEALDGRLDAWTGNDEGTLIDDESLSDFEDYINSRPAAEDNHDAHAAAEGTILNDFDPLLDEALADNEAFDAAKVAIEEKAQSTIESSAQLRQAQMIAKDVAARKNYQPKEGDNIDELAEIIKDKEDRIEALVSAFLDSEAANDLSTAEKGAILSAIYNATESAPVVTPESDPLDSETDDDVATTETVPGSNAPTTETVPGSNPLDTETDGDNEPTTEPAPESDPLDSETDDETEPTTGVNPLDSETDEDEPTTEPTPESDPLDSETDDDEEVEDTYVNDEEVEGTYVKLKGFKAHLHYAIYRVKNASRDFIESRGTEARNHKRAIALGAVGVVAAGFASWYAFGRHGMTTGGTGSRAHEAVATVKPSTPEVVAPTVPGSAGTGEGVPAPVPSPTPEVFSTAAHTVSSGEGWYQTMEELKIPAGDRAALLEKVGPKLEKMGAAYRDATIGGWGINIPANGQLSDKVLEVIASAR